MSELRTSVVVDMEGNLRARAERFGQSIRKMSQSGRRQLGLLRKSADRVGSAIGKLGNRYTAAGAAVGVVAAAKGVIDFDAQLQQLAIDADISDQRLAQVKQRIFEIANLPTLRVDTDQLLAGIKEVTARTGDIEIAMDNLESIGLLMAATGATGVDSGAMVANFYEKFQIKNPKQLLSTLDEAARLGKQGAFELRDLATEGNAVSAAYAATGRTGPVAAREMLALLQVIRRTTPSAAEAATSFERLISTLIAEKAQDLQNSGIQIWDPDKLKQGVKIARDIPGIIRDILKASNADPEKLANAFDIRALRAINAFALEYKETGALPSMDRFMRVRGNGDQLRKDAARNAETAAAALRSIGNEGKRVADSALSDTLSGVAGLINKGKKENSNSESKKLFRFTNDEFNRYSRMGSSVPAGSESRPAKKLIDQERKMKTGREMFSSMNDEFNRYSRMGGSVPSAEVSITVQDDRVIPRVERTTPDLDVKTDTGSMRPGLGR